MNMERKTIFLLISGLRVGGAEKFLVSLANGLDAEVFDLHLISFSLQNPLQAELRPDIRFHNFGRRGRFDVRPLLQLRKLMKEVKPDTVFSIGFFSFFLMVCASLLMRLKTKRVISYHGNVPRRRREDPLMMIYARCLGKDDLVITVSSDQARYTADRYHIPGSRFLTIHNGVDTDFWTLPPGDFDKAALRAQYGLPAEAPVIVKAAKMRVEKNHTGAIRALHVLHTTYHRKAFLLLVGDGPMKESARELAASLELADYVKFAGLQQDVRPFYWISDLFVLSSRIETFSIAALEAMACGLPCVLTDVGGAREMVVSGVNGLLCTTDESDMAQQWFRAFNTSFSPEQVHAHLRKNFNQADMVKKYTAILC